MIDKELLEILACPKCKAPVRLDEAAQRALIDRSIERLTNIHEKSNSH
jgi:uncharacterized protein YbaR (Trm112 family)